MLLAYYWNAGFFKMMFSTYALVAQPLLATMVFILRGFIPLCFIAAAAGYAIYSAVGIVCGLLLPRIMPRMFSPDVLAISIVLS